MTRYDQFLELQSQGTDECVLWPYAASAAGYGQVSKNGVVQYVHRLSCIIAHGSPHRAEHAAHSCHTPACFNPRHLRWASPAENATDRAVDGTENKGMRNGMARLDEDSVRQIRKARESGTPSRRVAEDFGVSSSAVDHIASGRSWGWLT